MLSAFTGNSPSFKRWYMPKMSRILKREVVSCGKCPVSPSPRTARRWDTLPGAWPPRANLSLQKLWLPLREEWNPSKRGGVQPDWGNTQKVIVGGLHACCEPNACVRIHARRNKMKHGRQAQPFSRAKASALQMRSAACAAQGYRSDIQTDL